MNGSVDASAVTGGDISISTDSNDIPNSNNRPPDIPDIRVPNNVNEHLGLSADVTLNEFELLGGFNAGIYH